MVVPATASAGVLQGRRRCGVLLHPTSLPDAHDRGALGRHARRFIDLLVAAGISVWQVLPIGPTHADRSPYHCASAHAGDPALIDLDELVDQGWLDAPAPGGPARPGRGDTLRAAYAIFSGQATPESRVAFEQFVRTQKHWLQDYALYQAFKQIHGGAPWWEWPPATRDRHPGFEARAPGAAVGQQYFEQFLFFRQWGALRRYANDRGVWLFGDMPIFVALDSAEVWSGREHFALDREGRPETVAGVPPDYFSQTGQRWGNPHYRWERLQEDGFQWWIERVRTGLGLFDLVRIDHFRGFEAYWSIPASEPTAVRGQWVQAPGEALLDALHAAFEPLPLVAEDLGIITDAVRQLRDRYRLPGMKILQFAFDGTPDNPYLPHNHVRNSVVYTGTHDNDTTLGWFEGLPQDLRARVLGYLGQPAEPMPWPLIRTALASVAWLSVVPLQDLLGLGSADRMNTPGTVEHNWNFRFSWDQIPPDLPGRVRQLVFQYGRLMASPWQAADTTDA